MLVLSALMTGCASSPPHGLPGLSGHVTVVAGPRQMRADNALASLPLSHASQPLKVVVVDSDEVGAFCWRSGKIVVTRALVDLVDDEELAAAIAHEAGHLLRDGHLQRPAALNGCASDRDAETGADLIGRELLRAGGLPHDALARLLQKVAAHSQTTQGCRDHLNRRIARLSAM
jgi:Zn-dependent protease with chaperone function